MKLNDAYVCLDCEEIFEGKFVCPSCASRAVWRLAKWLNIQQENLKHFQKTEANDEN